MGLRLERTCVSVLAVGIRVGSVLHCAKLHTYLVVCALHSRFVRVCGGELRGAGCPVVFLVFRSDIVSTPHHGVLLCGVSAWS